MASSYPQGLALGRAIIAEHQGAFLEAMACLDRGLAECLTVRTFPFAHRVKIRTTNLLERLFGEGKRRTTIILRFTSKSSG